MQTINTATSAPESIFQTDPSTRLFDSGIDSLNATALRSVALIDMLIEHLRLSEALRSSTAMQIRPLVDVLRQLSGNMELIQLITNTALANIRLLNEGGQ